ncbi:hypothetical protein L596_004174 [Steinernema carpocapsae]|uniref:Uncharacterized protein n=1 Tax=Steinernema carpocapsae TaxID=34508 RepID=A0A4U8UWJ1_STECR|nr:hypothetical protein L596_004174 [Steinernema carpocapsae]
MEGHLGESSPERLLYSPFESTSNGKGSDDVSSGSDSGLNGLDRKHDPMMESSLALRKLSEAFGLLFIYRFMLLHFKLCGKVIRSFCAKLSTCCIYLHKRRIVCCVC